MMISWRQKLFDCYKIIMGRPSAAEEKLRLDFLNSQNNNAVMNIKLTEMEELLSDQSSSIEKLGWELESISRLSLDNETLESLASLMSQIRLQESLIAQDKNVSARSIMKLAIGLVETLEENCLSPIGSVGEQVDFDPKKHKSINSGQNMEEGSTALIRFVGYSSKGAAIRKALVEEAE